MKKIYILAISFFAFHSMQAQITITNVDLPQVGDTFKLALDSNSVIAAPLTGTGVNWDYSSLEATPSREMAFTSKTGVLLASEYSSATMCTQGSFADVVGVTLPLPGGGLPPANAFMHYGTGGLLIDGFATDLNLGVINFGNVAFKATPNDVQFISPATFTDSYTGSSEYIGNNSTTGTQDTLIKIVIDRTIQTVGWGTLTTPFYTNQPAMLYREDLLVDVGFQGTVFGFVVLDSTLIADIPSSRYYFLTAGQGYPMLSMPVDGAGVVQSAEMLFQGTSSIINTDNSTMLSIQPNPASQSVLVNYEGALNENCTLTIVDMQGRIVSQQRMMVSTNTLAIDGLVGGMYIIRLQNDATIIAAKKLIVK